MDTNIEALLHVAAAQNSMISLVVLVRQSKASTKLVLTSTIILKAVQATPSLDTKDSEK